MPLRSNTATKPRKRGYIKKGYSEAERAKRSQRTKALQAQGKFIGGRWVKGQSANPGGIPKKFVELVELARGYTTEAINRIAEIMRTAEDPKVVIAAADMLMDRAWGRPPQALIARVMDDAANTPALGQMGKELLAERAERVKAIAAVLLELNIQSNSNGEQAEVIEVEVNRNGGNGNGNGKQE